MMVEPADKIIPDFSKAGTRTIIFHPEASTHIALSLQRVRDAYCKSGLVDSHYIPDTLDKLAKLENVLMTYALE